MSVLQLSGRACRRFFDPYLSPLSMNTPEEFATLLAESRRLASSGGGAMATLLRTRGPVFRRPGARMLIGRDGSIARGLSAGCPEADLVAQARAQFGVESVRLVRYDREHGYDALLELGCGGEMEILLETFDTLEDLRYLAAIETLLAKRAHGCLITAYARDGRCLKTTQRMIWSDAVVLDEMDRSVSAAVLQQLSVLPMGVVAETLASASGRFDVLFEPLLPPLSLYIVGDNVGARALARLACAFGWLVTLVDHRDDAPLAPLPMEVRFVRAGAATLLQQASFDMRSAVVVMTHNLERDLDYLRALRETPLAYLGALGSRQRSGRMHAELSPSVTPLHAPAGLDIGSETPEEIALAILAEIRAVTNGRLGGRLSSSDGPIH